MRKIIMVLGVILVLITLGCSTKDEKVIKDEKYNLAFLYSGYEGRSSQLNLVSDKVVDSKVEIKKNDAAHGETPIAYNKKHNIVLSYFYGGDGHCDGAVVGTNIKTKENIYYNVLDVNKACNVVGMATSGDYIYIVANNNGKNLFVEYNLVTRKKKEKWSRGFFTSELKVVDNHVYASYNAFSNATSSLWDMNAKTMNDRGIVIDDDKKLSYINSISNSDTDLYISNLPDNENYSKIKVNYIYHYTIKTGKIEKIKLNHNFVDKVLYDNDKVYISHSDFMGEHGDGYISIYNVKTKKLKDIKVKTSPKQMVVSNDKLYVYLEDIDLKYGEPFDVKNGEEYCPKAEILTYDINDNYKQTSKINPYDKDNKVKNTCFASFVSIEK